MFVLLPYMGTILSNLKQKSRSYLKNSLPQCNMKLTFKSINCLSSFFCFKDVILNELQPRLVHTFSCDNCKVTYYGKIECYLNVRCSDHLGILHLTEKRVELKPSAVPDYLLLHNHDSDFNGFTILFRDNNGLKF